MDDLPSELLAKIFDYLSNDDIINLPYRTVARGLPESKAIDRFKRKVEVSLEKQSLQRLLRLSNHTSIAQIMTELEFTLNKLVLLSAGPRKHLEHFGGCYQNHVAPGSARQFGLESDYYKTYERPSIAQTLNGGQDDHVRLLALALSSLPNVQTFSIDDGRGAGSDYWCPMDDQILKKGSYLMGVLLKVLSRKELKVSEFRILSDASPLWVKREADTPEYTAALMQLSDRTIALAASNFTKLKLRSTHSGTENNLFYNDNNLTPLPRPCYSRVQKSGLEATRSRSLVKPARVVEQVLQSSFILEELKFEFIARRGWCEYMNLGPQVLINELRGSNPLACLRRVNFTRFKTEEKELAHFFLAISGTIEHILLDGIMLTEGHWDSVFKGLQGKLANLNEIIIGAYGLRETSPQQLRAQNGTSLRRVHVLRFERQSGSGCIDALLSCLRDGMDYVFPEHLYV